MHVVDDKIDSSQGDFKLKLGTVYYKWTRTVKYDEYNDDTLGRSFIIDADTFPDDYKIVGETYIRNQKTGKDNRYQIVIYKANISSDTSIRLFHILSVIILPHFDHLIAVYPLHPCYRKRKNRYLPAC